MIRLDRNHKTIVTNRDEFVLNRFCRTTHQSFKRTRDARAQGRDLMTNLCWPRTGTIVEFARRQDLVSDASDDAVQISRQVFNQLPQHDRILTFSENGRSEEHTSEL